jgi:hypothetical protein
MARRVLESFGGLTLQPVLEEGRLWGPDPFTFGYDDADADECEELARLGQLYRVRLFPVSEDSVGTMLIGDGGQLFTFYGDLFICFGETFEEALECLLFARRRFETWGEGNFPTDWQIPDTVARRLGLDSEPQAHQRPSTGDALDDA